MLLKFSVGCHDRCRILRILVQTEHNFFALVILVVLVYGVNGLHRKSRKYGEVEIKSLLHDNDNATQSRWTATIIL